MRGAGRCGGGAEVARMLLEELQGCDRRWIMQQNDMVLIIEDDQAAAQYLAATCQQLGISPIIATDCVTGLKLATTKRPRLIFSDLRVPGLDGFEAARRIRSDRNLDGTAVVAVTDCAPKAPAANQVAFDDYVLKPISRDSIQNMISKYC
jgi:CheY-like chemotaxis protein